MQNGRLSRLIKFLLSLGCCFIALCVAKAVVAAGLETKDPWVRLAPPTARVNAAYMSLINHSDQTIIITQIDADCCAMTMLHETRQEGDRVTMVHLDELEVPPQSTIHMRPGGLHMMLMRPAQALREGDSVRLTLTLNDGSFHTVLAPVRASHE